MIGLDSGFFIRLLQEDERALTVWSEVVTGLQTEALLSCISLYELQRNGLKGVVPKAHAETLLETLPDVCRVLWLEPETIRRAAYIAHGNALSMADALILTSLMVAGAERIYTTDSDFETYRGGVQIIRL